MFIKPTPEQENAIVESLKGQSFKIIAYAGSGKTSTLQLISSAIPHTKGIYIAFNRAIATEASKKFQRNVFCTTFHSLAFKSSPRWLTDKIRLPKLQDKHIVAMYRLQPVSISSVLEGKPRAVLQAAAQARLITETINHYCSTAAQCLHPRHFKHILPDWIDPLEHDRLATTLFPHALDLWHKMVTANNTVPISHATYLKYWSNTNPVIPYPTIYFDESQDADPVMLSILMKQQAQVIYVGDPYQQLYEWRGAINAMQQLPLPSVRLTQSFRFGQSCAAISNSLLSHVFGEHEKLRGSDNVITSVFNETKTREIDAILCRKNSTAISELIFCYENNIRAKFLADSQKIMKILMGFESLVNNTAYHIPELEGFNNWAEVQAYVEANPFSDISPIVKLIDKCGYATLKEIILKSSEVKEYDCVVTTVHKSKGLEFNRVKLADDFMFSINSDLKTMKVRKDEARLIYVACTRAKNELYLGSLSSFFKAIQNNYQYLHS